MNTTKTFVEISIGILVYTLFIAVILFRYQTNHITITNSMISIDGIYNLRHFIHPIFVILFHIVPYIVIPIFVIKNSHLQKKSIIDDTTIQYLAFGSFTLFVSDFLLALPQFQFSIPYFLTWLFALIFVTLLRTIPIIFVYIVFKLMRNLYNKIM